MNMHAKNNVLKITNIYKYLKIIQNSIYYLNTFPIIHKSSNSDNLILLSYPFQSWEFHPIGFSQHWAWSGGPGCLHLSLVSWPQGSNVPGWNPTSWYSDQEWPLGFLLLFFCQGSRPSECWRVSRRSPTRSQLSWPRSPQPPDPSGVSFSLQQQLPASGHLRHLQLVTRLIQPSLLFVSRMLPVKQKIKPLKYHITKSLITCNFQSLIFHLSIFCSSLKV